MVETILAVDIGAGTQDILLYEEGIPVENCVKLVLPSQTRIMAGRIARATAQKQDIYLCGSLMGGGPIVRALRQHLAAGLGVYATPYAAKTIRDDIREVEAMGVQIVEKMPQKDCIGLYLQDLDLDGLGQALSLFDVAIPETVAVAVQDHGEAIGKSNRKFRFEHWEAFLARGGRISDLIYREVPPYLTRMLAVQEAAPGALMMDTGAAAIRGALLDPVVGGKQEEGVMVVNVGNQHVLAALVKGERIWGIFEHHTGLMTHDKLRDYLSRFARGEVTNEEVYNDGGHGCARLADAPGPDSFNFIAVTGPQRKMAEGLGYFAVPFGDMMLSGCFGLVAAVKEVLQM
ncbi:MAG TPA: DUF1786 domain-containing protein [Syntrophomonadaceae bacterium]|nr:DUF1786 domain-containing protein [Syntrophomonadaceae bacterium]